MGQALCYDRDKYHQVSAFLKRMPRQEYWSELACPHPGEDTH